MAKIKFGYMKCETRKCINGDGGPGRVVVFVNEHKTLSYRCDECGSTPYVKEGSGQYAAWLRDVEKSPAPAPQPAKPPAEDKKKDAPPPDKKSSGLFV